jgi:hypothetical protein
MPLRIQPIFSYIYTYVDTGSGQMQAWFGRVGTSGNRPKFGEARLDAQYALALVVLGLAICPGMLGGFALAQTAPPVSVLTAHNDNTRQGQNINETYLTPATVNTSTFGKLFFQATDGGIFAQPLYVQNVTVNGKVHNVVYVGDYGDDFYAFDADSNGGADANPLWKVSFLTNGTLPAGTYTPRFGVQGTPVIDPSSKTIYLVSSESEGTTPLFRLHALDIGSGAEKFGGPVNITGSITPATGSGSTNGTLTFDATYERQRAALLLQNGVVYVAFASTNDTGPWHGWIFSYRAPTLERIDTFCTTADGSGAGIWMGGAGLVGQIDDPVNKPYGRMFFATGNGSYEVNAPTTTGKPYSNPANQYAMSVLNLDLTGGVMTVQDDFTPTDWQLRNGQDGDLGSGGPILLPTQTAPSGAAVNSILEVGKTGTLYLLNQNNLGGFNATSNQVLQQIQTPESSTQNWGAGVWGTEAFWNNNIYYGGTDPGNSTPLAAYSFTKGQISPSATSQSNEEFAFPGPTPSVSANGNTNGIVWVLNNSNYYVGTTALYAHDATNLGTLLYSSAQNPSRDTPGGADTYTIPTVAHGKVYVPTSTGLAVFGLFAGLPGGAQRSPAPVISSQSTTFAAGQTVTFTGTETITISDSLPNTIIYYTVNGTTPDSYSSQGTAPLSLTVSQNETVTAIASTLNYLQSIPVAVIFSSTSNAANPVFSLAAGAHSGTQQVTITDATATATICYTVDGSTPNAGSTCYTPSSHAKVPLTISVPVSETVQAIATAPGLLASSVVSVAYAITPVYTFDFSQGFTTAKQSGQMQFNGSTDLDDFRLQLTNGGENEAGSAFYARPVNIQQFTTDFTFQLSNPGGDGITFTIQNSGPTALGGYGAGLGFVTIQNSVAIKFDLVNNAGEGPDSTGLYTWGNLPTVPSINLTSSGINLHDGNYKNVHITYDGVTLSMTITDPLSLATFSTSWAINIPAKVFGNTAWVGFTGATGANIASQKLTSWTYLAGPPAVPNYPVGIDSADLILNGATIAGSGLQLTTAGATNHASTAYYALPVDVEAFTSTFDFTIKPPAGGAAADGMTFVIQNAGPKAIGGYAAGLGYVNIPNSVAIKFDIYNNAGEGNDSTGVFTYGNLPTVPAIDLTSSGLQLGNGHTIQAVVSYDGTTLTWGLTDLSDPIAGLRATETKVIDIPHYVGGNVAYIGFTGATGLGTSTQTILNWTFANP